VGKLKFWAREAEAESPRGRSFGSLADRILAGPIPLSEALRYAIELAEALREVHGRGRTYGALHPANVSLVEGRAQLTFSAPMAVSPYFSPEQVAGRDLDARTDIFSLGALAYEMLSGRKAFDAATKPALRIAILDCDPPPLEGVPPALWRLIRRCLEKKPERRLQRMEILLAELKLQAILAS
jgi:serine/threonine protein kinase